MLAIKTRWSSILLATLLLSGCDPDEAAGPAQNNEMITAVAPDASSHHAELGALFYAKTRLKPQYIEASPIPGFKQIGANADLFYISDDGRLVIRGAVFDVEQNMRNLTQQRVQSGHATLLAENKPEAITFAATDQRAEVYVFTDSSCGFCARIHSYIPEYNQQGVTVHYLAYPRGGERSSALKEMEAAWCAEDSNAAFNELIRNRSYSGQHCDDSPVMAQFHLGDKLGVRGTPAIFTSQGRMIPGAITVNELLKQLNLPERS